MKKKDSCVLCGAKEGGDLRTLKIDCFYKLEEVSPLLKYDKKENTYKLLICKGCRATFLFYYLNAFIHNKGRFIEPSIDESGNRELNKEEVKEMKRRMKV